FARWFVVIAAALALPAQTLGIDGTYNTNPIPYVGPVLLLMAVAVVLGAPILRTLLVCAGVAVVAVPVILIAWLGIGWTLGPVLTDLAGNPPVNSADTD